MIGTAAVTAPTMSYSECVVRYGNSRMKDTDDAFYALRRFCREKSRWGLPAALRPISDVITLAMKPMPSEVEFSFAPEEFEGYDPSAVKPAEPSK